MNKLTERQRNLLNGLDGVEGWMPFAWLKPNDKQVARRLKVSGLVKIRGGVGVPSIRLPVEIAITPAGRLAISGKADSEVTQTTKL